MNWWWPTGDPADEPRFWPAGAPREETVSAFLAAFASLGYTPCDDAGVEPGFEKVALFVDARNAPTHAARQLADGRWTSKLGRSEDIEHELHALEGDVYGRVAVVLRRPQPSAAEAPSVSIV